jgi:hypothetical protein
MQVLVDELSDPNTAGQILYGACLTRKYANVTYNYPTPTLGKSCMHVLVFYLSMFERKSIVNTRYIRF